jgi:hypothetical protein
MSSLNGGGCPTAEELLAFAAGRLSGDAWATLGEHLEGCPACLAALEGLPQQADPLLAELRRPLPAELFTHTGARPPSALPGAATSAADGPAPGGQPPGGEGGAAAAGAVLPAVPGYEVLAQLGRAAWASSTGPGSWR